MTRALANDPALVAAMVMEMSVAGVAVREPARPALPQSC
jgi:hypothetical protein